MSDSKNSKGGAHLSDAHLPNVDEVKSPRPRQAGSMLMASARIEADANCKPGDPLTPILRKQAATYAERVRTEAPEYMQRADRRRAAGCGRAAPVRHQGRGRRPSGDRSESADPGWGAQRWGKVVKMCDEPLLPSWKLGLAVADACPRCGAKRRRGGGTCRAPAMANGRCRLHGGKSTGPRTPEGLERSRRARLVHGYYTAEAKAARAEARRTMRALHLLLREAKSE